MQGRRIQARSRYRSGNLMDADGTLDDSVAPTDAGSTTDGETGGDDSLLGVDIGLGISL